MRKSRLCIFVLILLAGSLPLLAGTPVVSIQRIDLTGLPEIRVYFTVTDEKGDSILGLTRDELDITLDDIALPDFTLTSALEGGEYLAVVLLFDRSGSMKAALDQTREAALGFVRRMSADDQAAVISFDDNVKLEMGLTQDKSRIEDAIRGIPLGRNTALYDALGMAADLFQGVPTRRQAIIVLSDGKDTRSKTTRDAAVSKARTGGIPIYSIGLGKSIREEALSGMADATGGHYFEAAVPEHLLLLYQKIAEQLQSQYRASFRPGFEMEERWYDLKIKAGEPDGPEGAAKREFIASLGPGVGPDVIGGFQGEITRRKYVQGGAVGAAFGLLLGLVLAALLKLLRPEIRLFSPLMIAAVIFASILGGIVAVVVVMIG